MHAQRTLYTLLLLVSLAQAPRTSRRTTAPSHYTSAKPAQLEHLAYDLYTHRYTEPQRAFSIPEITELTGVPYAVLRQRATAQWSRSAIQQTLRYYNAQYAQTHASVSARSLAAQFHLSTSTIYRYRRQTISI
jgi:hypothetical protein